MHRATAVTATGATQVLLLPRVKTGGGCSQVQQVQQEGGARPWVGYYCSDFSCSFHRPNQISTRRAKTESGQSEV